MKDQSARLVLKIPAEALEGLESGRLGWTEARDGSGFIPVLTDQKGTFVKQVRVVDPGATQAAVDLARSLISTLATQAALKEISVSLGRIEDSVNLLLERQFGEQVGILKSAHQRLLDLRFEEGDACPRTEILASIEADVSKVSKILIQWIDSDVKRVDLPKVGWRAFWEAGWSPAERYAKQLDDIEEKLLLSLCAARLHAEVHREMGRPLLARKRMSELADFARPVQIKVGPLYDFAQYSERRQAFWGRELPLLASGQQTGQGDLVVETSVGELLG